MKKATKFVLSEDWKQIAACVDEYERESRVALPDLRVVLDRVNPADRVSAMMELVMTDLEHRWKRNEQKPVDAYLEEFEELGGDAAYVAELFRADEAARRHAMEATISSSQMPVLREQNEFAPDDTSNPGGRLTEIEVRQADVDTVHDAKPPKTVDGYVIAELLGSGSFGAVYRGRKITTGEEAAIKIAKSRDLGVDIEKLARHETRAVCRLVHPNIVPLIDSGVLPDGRPYLIYQYIAGTTLDKRLTADDTPREQRLEWLAQLADALHHAHQSGLVHRDVKPSNVLVDNDDNPWMTDFGLAKIDDAYAADDTGSTLGTITYMSPEQASGRSHWATPQSDVYALGAMLYEALCGRPPFAARSSRELLRQICDRHPTAPRSIRDDIPAGLESVCLRSLAKDPANRIQTAGDFAAALRQSVRPERPGGAWLNGWGKPIAAALATGFAAVALAMAFSGAPVTPTEPPAATPEVSLYLNLQDAGADDGAFGFLDDDDLPLSAGQRVQVRAELNTPAYTYIFACRGGEALDLVGRPTVAEGGPHARAKAYFPAKRDTWINMPAEDGVMLFAVGASAEPLSESQLNELLAKRFTLPGPSAAPLLLRSAEPWPKDQSDRPNNTRGKRGGKGFDLETTKTYTLPKEIETAFGDTFAAHHIVMLTHKETTQE